jgi:predicted phosphohydrolase
MGLFIIGDLHLSFSTDKPMDVFGPLWLNHHQRLKDNWLKVIKETDTVIIAGDISWAINLEEAEVDLKWIDALPGKKILLRGNHDYWWSTLKKMRGKYESIDFLQNNAHIVDASVIVGTRGWSVPLTKDPENPDVKIYQRELQRFSLSIAAAPEGLEKIAILHFPPFDEKGNKSGFNDLIEQAGIKKVYFGHIHTHYHLVKQGVFDGVDYTLISGDYLEFCPLKIG